MEAKSPIYQNPTDIILTTPQAFVILSAIFQNKSYWEIEAMHDHNKTMKVRNGDWQDMKNCIFHLLSVSGSVY